MFGEAALTKLLKDYQFQTVLDIGCGEGYHLEVFQEAGKKVTGIDLGNSVYFKRYKNLDGICVIKSHFGCGKYYGEHDLIWACRLMVAI